MGTAGSGGRREGPRVGVVVFPGSNCDHDAWHVFRHVLGLDTVWLWHKEADLQGSDIVVLPGGFAHGDYLRCGAIARFSPVMSEVVAHARRGGYVLGICNGFQVLVEAGLLPGALIRNRDLKFICADVHLRVEREDTAFTSRYRRGQVLRMPISHGEGNYVADPATMEKLEAGRQVAFRYVAPDGREDESWNVNGSTGAIAGLVNEQGNVLGLMPHPDRAFEPLLGCVDGLGMFEGLAEAAGRAAAREGGRP